MEPGSALSSLRWKGGLEILILFLLILMEIIVCLRSICIGGMKRYALQSAAIEKKKDVQIVITQLRKDHTSSTPVTLHRFMKVLSQKPELVEQEIALCLWIAEAGLPFHCFELDSFKTFCKSIGFAPRSPDTWSSSIIPSMAHVVENQNRTLLNSASSFALAVDGWSDNGKICGAVAHFITPDMECHRQIFSAEEIRANSTNELLSASLFAILQVRSPKQSPRTEPPSQAAPRVLG